MLTGEVIRLRPVRAADIEQLYTFHQDVANRGEFFPVTIASEPAFRDAFSNSGFWSATEGMLLIVDDADAILGHIEFYQTLKYLDELELSYQLYTREHDGRGVVTDAVRLMSGTSSTTTSTTGSGSSSTRTTGPRNASPKSAGSRTKEPPAAPGCTAAGVRTSRSTRCCGRSITEQWNARDDRVGGFLNDDCCSHAAQP